MLFLAPIAGSVCSAVGGTIVRTLLTGGAVGGALAVCSAFSTAGKVLTFGAKAFTLAKAAKYAGAAYVGYRVGKRCRRQPGEQNQGRRERRVLYYVETKEGPVPVYGER